MPAAIPVASIASSVIGGALASRKSTSTSTQTSTPQWSPEMQQLMKQIQSYSSGLMTDPSAGTAPIKNAAMDSINRSYRGANDRVSRVLSSQGYGSSGKMGNTIWNNERARLGDLSTLEGQMASLILDRQNQGASLGERLLALSQGSTSTGSATTPGNVAGSAFMSGGNALENLSTLLMLSKVLKGAPSTGPSFSDAASLPTIDRLTPTYGIPGSTAGTTNWGW